MLLFVKFANIAEKWVHFKLSRVVNFLHINSKMSDSKVPKRDGIIQPGMLIPGMNWLSLKRSSNGTVYYAAL
jgi:hypothetical protein